MLFSLQRSVSSILMVSVVGNMNVSNVQVVLNCVVDSPSSSIFTEIAILNCSSTISCHMLFLLLNIGQYNPTSRSCVSVLDAKSTIHLNSSSWFNKTSFCLSNVNVDIASWTPSNILKRDFKHLICWKSIRSQIALENKFMSFDDDSSSSSWIDWSFATCTSTSEWVDLLISYSPISFISIMTIASIIVCPRSITISRTLSCIASSVIANDSLPIFLHPTWIKSTLLINANRAIWNNDYFKCQERWIHKRDTTWRLYYNSARSKCLWRAFNIRVRECDWSSVSDRDLAVRVRVLHICDLTVRLGRVTVWFCF